MSEPILPSGFEVLEPFVPQWSLATYTERARQRNNSTPSQKQAFFKAVSPLLFPALDYLDSKPIGQFSAADTRLLSLLLSFSHAMLAVEIQGPDEERHTHCRERISITQASADLPCLH